MTTAINVLANRLLSGRLKFGYPPLDLFFVRHCGECSLSPMAHANKFASLLGAPFIGHGCDHLVTLLRETGLVNITASIVAHVNKPTNRKSNR